MKKAVGVALVGLLSAVVPLAATAQENDPFYTRLLDDGIRASERSDHARASEDLRIAAFGLMESPELLARALTHLAVALSATGDAEGSAAALRRLAELETRFGAYSAADVDATARAALGRAARRHLPAEEIQDSPLIGLAPSAPAAPAAPAAQSPAIRAKLCISWTAGGECRQPGAAAAQPASELPAVAAAEPVLPSGPSPEELADFDRLSRLAAGKASPKRLREGFEEARALADVHPGRPEVQRVAGLLAARSGAYPEAVTYYRRSGELADDQPVEIFYLSVALFETGDVEEAATALRRALPGLRQNREVRRYVRRILPAEAQG